MFYVKEPCVPPWLWKRNATDRDWWMIEQMEPDQVITGRQTNRKYEILVF